MAVQGRFRACLAPEQELDLEAGLVIAVEGHGFQFRVGGKQYGITVVPQQIDHPDVAFEVHAIDDRGIDLDPVLFPDILELADIANDQFARVAPVPSFGFLFARVQMAQVGVATELADLVVAAVQQAVGELLLAVIGVGDQIADVFRQRVAIRFEMA